MLVTHNSTPAHYLMMLKKVDDITLEQDSVNKTPAVIILYDVEPDYVQNRVAVIQDNDKLIQQHVIIVIVNEELTNKKMFEYYEAGATVVCDYAITPSALRNLIKDITIGETYNSLTRKPWTNSCYNLSEKTSFSGASGTLYTCGKQIELNNKEREILQILLDNRGEYISKKIILTTLWGNTETGSSRSFDVYINRLRHALDGDDDVDLRKIRNRGYALVRGEENKKIKNKY